MIVCEYENELKQNELKQILKYFPKTGNWKRKKTVSSNAKKGEYTGTLNTNGYIVIGINNKLYYAHRLAFLYMDGYFPENHVDHIDKNPSNNKWCNLREVSHQCNTRNRNTQKNNKSKVSGVYWCKINKKWIAQITINYKTIALGGFKYKNDAIIARWIAEIEYNWGNCNSTSPAYLYLKKKNLLCSKKVMKLLKPPKLTKIIKTKKTKVYGVCLHKANKKWHSYITINRKRIHLGFFKKKKEAIKIRWEAENNYSFGNCNTTSSAYLWLKKRDLV